MKLTIQHVKRIFEIPDATNDMTVAELKRRISSLTQVPASMMKLIGIRVPKGTEDETNVTISQCGAKEGTKIMVVGNSIEQVIAANTTDISPDIALLSTQAANGSCNAPASSLLVSSGQANLVNILPNGSWWTLPFYQGVLTDPFIDGRVTVPNGGRATTLSSSPASRALAICCFNIVMGRISKAGLSKLRVFDDDAVSRMDHPFFLLNSAEIKSEEFSSAKSEDATSMLTSEARRALLRLQTTLYTGFEISKEAEAALVAQERSNVIKVVKGIVKKIEDLAPCASTRDILEINHVVSCLKEQCEKEEHSGDLKPEWRTVLSFDELFSKFSTFINSKLVKERNSFDARASWLMIPAGFANEQRQGCMLFLIKKNHHIPEMFFELCFGNESSKKAKLHYLGANSTGTVEDTYTVTLINTNPQTNCGLSEYHVHSYVNSFAELTEGAHSGFVPDKIKAQTCVTLTPISKEKLVDVGFWIMVLMQWGKGMEKLPGVSSEYCRAEIVYDVLLPWLVEQDPTVATLTLPEDLFFNNSGGREKKCEVRFTSEPKRTPRTLGLLMSAERQSCRNNIKDFSRAMAAGINTELAASFLNFNSTLGIQMSDFFSTQRSAHSGAAKSVMHSVYYLTTSMGVKHATAKRLKFIIKYETYFRAAEELHIALLKRRNLAQQILDFTCGKKYAARLVAGLVTSSSDMPKRSTSPILPQALRALDEYKRVDVAIKDLNAAGVNASALQLLLKCFFDALIGADSISDTIASGFSQRGIVKNKDDVLISPEQFLNGGKFVVLYFGASWCQPCKRITPLVIELYQKLQTRFGGADTAARLFEFIAVPIENSQDDYESFVQSITFPRISFCQPATKRIMEAMSITEIPQIMIFGVDGALITATGVKAIMQDPDGAKFPGMPWNGALLLNTTDMRMLKLGGALLAHHTLRMCGGECVNASIAETEKQNCSSADFSALRTLSDEQATQVSKLIDAVDTALNVLPTKDDNGDTHDPLESTCEEIYRDSVESVELNFDKLLPVEAARFENRGALFDMSSRDKYLGHDYNVAVLPLDDIGGLTPPENLTDLALCLFRATKHVKQLWARARNSATSSRVAAQMQIIEFITWLFGNIIPVPRPKELTDACFRDAITPEDQRVLRPFLHLFSIFSLAPNFGNNLFDINDFLYTTVTSSFYWDSLPDFSEIVRAGELQGIKVVVPRDTCSERGSSVSAWAIGQSDPSGGVSENQRQCPINERLLIKDTQLMICTLVYYMMLSLVTAWQAIETPTRAFDAERIIISATILAVYDAVARNTKNSLKCLYMASILSKGNTQIAADRANEMLRIAENVSGENSSNVATHEENSNILEDPLEVEETGFSLSTSIGKYSRKFSDATFHLEIRHPRLQVIRNAVITYQTGSEILCKRQTIFDLPFTDGLEVEKNTNTILFLRRLLEACGYRLGGEAPNASNPEQHEERDESGRAQEAIARALGRGQTQAGPIGGNEMEKLMFWFCDDASPLAREHPEFAMLRDMVILMKFMCTMEMRDVQLLRKRKDLDNFASWMLTLEEDAPGRRMSSSWRTKPMPPVWDLALIRGRNQDVAVVTVHGFGNRDVNYGEGLLLQSPIDVGARLRIENASEEDILHAPTVPTFGGLLSDEDAETLWSILTVPYMRIPLALDFFSTQERHVYLMAPAVQNVVRALLFESGSFVFLSDTKQNSEMCSVPLRLSEKQRREAVLEMNMSAVAKGDTTLLLGSPYGLLLNELIFAPKLTVAAWLRIVSTICDLGTSSVYSPNASYMLFVADITCTMIEYVEYVLNGFKSVEKLEESTHVYVANPSETVFTLKDALGSLRSALVQIFLPLLDSWLTEAEENSDLPTQCVVHSYRAMVHNVFPSENEGELTDDLLTRLQSILVSCSFVRARYGFGMGWQRSQLVSTDGDDALTPEQKLLRFLQAQGLRTSHVTPDMLNQWRQLMLATAEGRRRTVFVRINGRSYSDTVRVPNLFRLSVSGTSESKALRLPPVDVPENDIFYILQSNYMGVATLLKTATDNVGVMASDVLDGVCTAVVRTVLPDKMNFRAQEEGSCRWVVVSPGVVTAPAQKLTFHILTCELFWKGADLKPVPDTMTRFSDYEIVLGNIPATDHDVGELLKEEKNAGGTSVTDDRTSGRAVSNQCALVQRTEHRHWVHVVGTVYDLIHWDEHEYLDQGNGFPLLLKMQKNPASSSSSESTTSGAGNRRQNRTAENSVRRLNSESIEREEEEHVLVAVIFEGIKYSRPVDPFEDIPWSVPSERWAVDAVKTVFTGAYTNKESLQFFPFLPESEYTLSSPEDATELPNGELVLRETVRMMTSDEMQFPDDPECMTVKEFVVSQDVFLRRCAPSTQGKGTTQPAQQIPSPIGPYGPNFTVVSQVCQVNVFTIVSHARRLYRVLHYSTNQKFNLASLPIVVKPRYFDGIFKMIKYEAGDVKRRCKNDGSLEIHRYNTALKGREIYVPARLLQGTLPSTLLENMFFWLGEDRLIRGYPVTVTEEEQVRTGGISSVVFGADEKIRDPSIKSQETTAEIQNEWFNYIVELQSFSENEEKLKRPVSEFAGLPFRVIRRGAKRHRAIRRELPSDDPIESEDNISSLEQNYISTMLEFIGSSPLIFENDNQLKSVELSSADRQRLCLYALRNNNNSVYSAIEWLKAEVNRPVMNALYASFAKQKCNVEGEKKIKCGKTSTFTSKDEDDVEDLVLLRLHDCPALIHLARLLTRIENASHILLWAHKAIHGTQEGFRLHLIELPRLKAKLFPSYDDESGSASESGVEHLWLADHPGWRIATEDEFNSEPRLAALQEPFEEAITMFNANTGDFAFFLPSHDFVRFDVLLDTFNRSLLFDRSSQQWQQCVPSSFYLIPVHSSCEFLVPPSLSSLLYLVAILTARQEYARAMRFIDACYVDIAHTAEEGYMFALMERTLTTLCNSGGDFYPDAHSIRLRLAHSVIYSPNKPNYDLSGELVGYLMKYRHVSRQCRLEREELTDLLKRTPGSSALLHAQVEYWAAVSGALTRGRGSSTATLHLPAPRKGGEPWERLLTLPLSMINCAGRITRMTFKEPDFPMNDNTLLSFLWSDVLLADEVSGANSDLGFFFLYLLGISSNALEMKVGTENVLPTILTLLRRCFYLRHSRWGLDLPNGGNEGSAPTSVAFIILAFMEQFPDAGWPELTDVSTIHAMRRGMNINEQPTVRWRGQEVQAPGQRRMQTPAQEWIRSLEVRLRELRIQHSGHRVRSVYIDSDPLIVPCINYIIPRVEPADTSVSAVKLLEGASDGVNYISTLKPVTLESMSSFLFAEIGLFSRYITEKKSVGEDINSNKKEMPFSLDAHPRAQNHVARDMLRRLKGDMHTFQERMTAMKQYSPVFLAGEADLLACIDQEGNASPDELVRCATLAIKGLKDLIETLQTLGTEDQLQVRRLSNQALKLANEIYKRGESKEEREVLLLRLSRICRHRNLFTVEWLIGALLSRSMEQDIANLNPYNGGASVLRQVLVALMMFSIRASFCRQVRSTAAQLKRLFELVHSIVNTDERIKEGNAQAIKSAESVMCSRAAALEIDYEAPSRADDTSEIESKRRNVACVNKGFLVSVRGKYVQLCRNLVEQLSIQRHFVDKEDSDFLLDPRFLLFEFVFNIVLRQRQVEMIRWFYDNVKKKNLSRVQQMIMGQGKTTVVGPLLALMLSDGNTLVMQVMPTPLLEQTRTILHRCFTMIIPKRIFTLQFDRAVDDSVEVVEALYQKLHSALRRRSLVVSAPECIKALFLKYIELLYFLHSLTADDLNEEVNDESKKTGVRRLREAELVHRKLVARSQMADAIEPILRMWKEGVLIMDEVDVILHPLKSELNFPIGLKYPIELSGDRWRLPMHILSGIFYCSARYNCLKKGTTYFNQSDANTADPVVSLAGEECTSERTGVLDKLLSVLTDGIDRRKLQREPHIVLLDTNFYHEEMKHLVAQWTIFWLWDVIKDPEAKRRQRIGETVTGNLNLEYFEFKEIAMEFLLHSRSLSHTAGAKSEKSEERVRLDNINERLHATLLPYSIQLLFLARDWVDMLLPHCLSKIDRVSYGILQPADYTIVLQQMLSDASSGAGGSDFESIISGSSIPLSRRLMVVPFVAKDVPSRSSEYAHPDVVIGLTILAYRHEGMRRSDIQSLLKQLKQDYSRQSGPRELRPASAMYNRWVKTALQERARRSESVEGLSIVPLSQLQLPDRSMTESAWDLLHDLPELIYYYLNQQVFPRTITFQKMKISACGHELGSDILFGRRIGFSGTPSNLLPLDLGECFYEPGSDGRILSVLTDPQVTSCETLEDEWTPMYVLRKVAAASPCYHALIDTGALITNIDNQHVARILLHYLPRTFEGVVFFDSRDRKMVLERGRMQVIALGQCGIAPARRFTFIDQVHATGMDILQSPTAVAVVTVSADMVFRDYAQGCFRMRGIGKGQKIRVYVIPEVVSRICETLSESPVPVCPKQVDVLAVPAWLLLNAMRVEGLQFLKLSLQEIDNFCRKLALRNLVNDSADANSIVNNRVESLRIRRFVSENERAAVLRLSIRVFLESVGYPLPSTLVPLMPYAEKLRDDMKLRPMPLLSGSAATAARARLEPIYARMESSMTSIEGGTYALEAGLGLNTEVVHEQEAEEEQQQEAEQEEQRISAYSRDDEEQIPWDVRCLSRAVSDAISIQDGTNIHEIPMYPVSEFQVRVEQPKIDVPHYLMLSHNFFRKLWIGLGERRLRNCVTFLQWVLPYSDQKIGPALTAVVTLAEAETLRWMMHYNKTVATEVPFALRVVGSGAYLDISSNYRYVMSCVDRENLSRDVSSSWDTMTLNEVYDGYVQQLNAGFLSQNSALHSSEHPSSLAALFDVAPDPASLWFRFFNNDVFYTPGEIKILNERVLMRVSIEDRVGFFTECLRLRRRNRNQWEDSPAAQLLANDDDLDDLRCAASLRQLISTLDRLVQIEVSVSKEIKDAVAESQLETNGDYIIEQVDSAFDDGTSSKNVPNSLARIATTKGLLSPLRASFKTNFDSPECYLTSRAAADSLRDAVCEYKEQLRDARTVNGPHRDAVKKALSQLSTAIEHHLLPVNFNLAIESIEKKQHTLNYNIIVDALPQLSLDVSPLIEEETSIRSEFLQRRSWTCSVCTLINAYTHQTCAACGARCLEREDNPANEQVGGSGTASNSQRQWNCTACTFLNEPSALTCEICNTPNPENARQGVAESSLSTFHVEVPEGKWMCLPEHGGCTQFNDNEAFYCSSCDKARPDLASLRF